MHGSFHQGIPEAHYGVCGHVAIDPSAAIAPGTSLIAQPGCHLSIGVGVCIGAGCVIHVFGGNMEIAAGATLGPAVLLVGSGKIGANACIGSMSTVFNPAIEPGQVVSQGSYMGPMGIEDAIAGDSPSPHVSVSEANLMDTVQSAPGASRVPPESSQPVELSNGRISGPSPGTQVYGLEAFYRLMAMLFPHRQFPSGLPYHPATAIPDPSHNLPEGRND